MMTIGSVKMIMIVLMINLLKKRKVMLLKLMRDMMLQCLMLHPVVMKIILLDLKKE